MPPSFVPDSGSASEGSAPIHTFGFGNDHDAAAMQVVVEATGGTFSFIENEAVIQDAFAQCIGGMLTVVVQVARVAMACGHPGGHGGGEVRRSTQRTRNGQRRWSGSASG